MPGAAFIFDAVDRDAGVFGLEQFLERRFVIAQRGAGSQFGGQLLGGFGKDVEACKSSHRLQSAIEKQRADHCLHGV